jgi:microcystin degradation protein MlrC
MIAPASVARLIEAGEGATVSLPLGGHAATRFFQPIEVTGRVKRIGGGVIPLNDHHQREVDMGRTVVFESGPVTLLVSELRGVAGNVPDVYRALGVEPADYKMAVLKTASNFQFFAPISSQVIRVDTRGPGQSDVMTLPWSRVPRPIYPLDPIQSWRG